MRTARLDREKKKQSHDPFWLGKLMAKLPAWPIFYPIYEASQLNLMEELYWSPRIPAGFDDFRIVYLSDIHFGPLFSEERVRDLAQRVNKLHADVVILGGDYAVNSDGAVEFFQRLKPGFQAKTAVLGVMGNHDRMLPEENFEKLLAAMREDGVTPLVNDGIVLERRGSRMAIVSCDDFYCGKPDLKKTAALSKKADFTVFCPHMPDVLPETYKMPGPLFYQLALCGHTHGGQVAVMGRAIRSSSIYGSKYLSGWYHEHGADILVSNGVGVSGLPVRWGAKPQMHLITMKKEET
ncbi:MAG: metallophosphoesterase [Clostridia bacterium]|nr:metallophosphoesterase [Clostridia bacterium]MBR0408776.1 metallophosphoesterase [Clostridia bacterium]